MSTAALPQLIYVVRLWSSDSPTETVWRSTVQNPITGERHVFASLDEFFAFIEETTRAATTAESMATDAD
jgi:hypothetical protein